jgi:hypothetical protein
MLAAVWTNKCLHVLKLLLGDLTHRGSSLTPPGPAGPVPRDPLVAIWPLFLGGSRQLPPDGGRRTRPPIPAVDGRSLTRTGQSGHFIESAVRPAARPRARRAAGSRGLNPAQPRSKQQRRQPGQRDSTADAADDYRPSRHDRGRAPRDLTNSDH